ncbi:MAG: hypothetical protein KAH20_03305 [Methylococcales bacterium]|nr:hypothetical protein [Methylococcales bacterium]
MNTLKKILPNKPKESAENLPTLLTIICHLMTCYAIRPSEVLAINIHRHMDVLLTSTTASELKEWKPTFLQLQVQWASITQRHQLQQKKTDKRGGTH